MPINDSDIHKGHRQRMRRKFALHSSRPFDTYELLEMLLYHVIPYKDTNPVSKNLLAEFGSLDGVFSANKGELMAVAGIGEAVADFILTIGNFISHDSRSIETSRQICFDSYQKAGEHFLDYFRGSSGNMVAMMLLDNRMNLIGTRTLYSLDYASGAVRAEAFIDYALANRASVAMIAHNHPFGPLFPTAGDVATNNMISDALFAAGVTLAEHYVISGERYTSMMGYRKYTFSSSPELERFFRSREVAVNV